tara:strand:- start:15 stop:392 length:378 start_codon:yes stop_codon:yes gene_type:complete
MANISNQGVASQAAFGQFGSTFSVTVTETIKPPAGMVIVAITFLGDTTLDILTAEKQGAIDDGGGLNKDSSFNHTNEGAASAAANGEPINDDIIFPKGLTVYGRWTEVRAKSVTANTGYIAYFAP